MLRPSMIEIAGENPDAYTFVVAVAKRAREISDAAKEEGETLDENCVASSIKEFAKGDCSYYKEK